MPLFSKPKVVIWPKATSVEVYLDKKDNNTLTFDINLWEEKGQADLQPILVFLKQNRVDSCSVLIPDDIVSTKSFIYDSQITTIDKKEVIGLAESFVHFKIDPDSIQYNLVPGDNKTIIQAIIFDKKKIDILNKNLAALNLKVNTIRPVSASIANIIKNYFAQEYFFLYPLNSSEYTLFLAKADSVYLTATVKGPSLDIQKIINYSNLYFTNPTKKIYSPSNKELELPTTGNLEKTPYTESQIATEVKKASNLPLPVLGLMLDSNVTVAPTAAPVIINKPQETPSINTSSTPTMENKRNILPIIAVFIFTAALASVIIWFVLNRGKTTTETPSETPIAEITPTVEITPTATPTPVVAEISKNIKIQVLNATDINGQAATVKEMLTKLGFTSVAVGNSKEKATENKVQLKPSLATASAYFESKMTDFPATYTTDLKATGTYDAVFIIGTDLKTGASAADTSTSSAATND